MWFYVKALAGGVWALAIYMVIALLVMLTLAGPALALGALVNLEALGTGELAMVGVACIVSAVAFKALEALYEWLPGGWFDN